MDGLTLPVFVQEEFVREYGAPFVDGWIVDFHLIMAFSTTLAPTTHHENIFAIIDCYSSKIQSATLHFLNWLPFGIFKSYIISIIDKFFYFVGGLICINLPSYSIESSITVHNLMI